MELLWVLLFAFMCLAVGGLFHLCDLWLAPSGTPRR